MANTVAYNNGSNPVGSIKKGVVSINIDNSLITSGHTWRNGIEIVNQYIIYSDTYTQGIDTQQNAKPCAWSCAYNDASLLNLINSLPPLIGQPKYSTLADGIAWLEGQNKYFLVNQSYPEIVTSGCVLNVDAGLSGSYPNVGTNWYNISGFGTNGSLLNNPTWVNSGTSSYFLFDGTDDRVNFGSNTIYRLKDNMAFNFTFYLSDTSGETLVTRGEQVSKGFYWIMIYGALPYFQYQNTNGDIIGVQPGYTFSTGKWYNMSVVIDKPNLYFYINSQLINTTDISNLGLEAFDSDLYIGSYNTWTNNWQLNGRISLAQIYNKSLSQSEVLQNYYRGKLVTSGLILALDAGNLVSYGGDGTTWYDMTSNANNGTLVNGVTYSGGTTPSMVFDGVDDYVNVPYNASKISFPENNATICVWFNSSPSGDNYGCLVTQRSVNGFQTYVYGNKFYADGGGVSNGVYSTTTIIPGTTYFGCAVYDKTNSLLKIYVNGNYESQYSYTGNIQDTYPIRLGNTGTFSDGPYPGNIFAAQVYNRALSASEISQNFNTYRRRYGI
jgi:hypothetical protein